MSLTTPHTRAIDLISDANAVWDLVTHIFPWDTHPLQWTAKRGLRTVVCREEYIDCLDCNSCGLTDAIMGMPTQVHGYSY